LLVRRHLRKIMDREPWKVSGVRLDTHTRRSATLSGGLAVDAHAAQGCLK
jgi:hypothetical protein